MSPPARPAVPLPRDPLADPVLRGLGGRQKQVLRIVVEEYVSCIRPVGSRKIAQDETLTVSAATIRNDLARLERLGLVTKTHTSSGRVPTLLGYRLYATYLAGEQRLSRAKRRRIHAQFSALRRDSRHWLHDATQLLSTVSRSLALATELKYATNRFKHVELIAVRPRQILMVLVTEEGHVHQRLFESQALADQERLSAVSRELNEALSGCTEREIRDQVPALPAGTQDFGTVIAQTMPVTRRDARRPAIVQRGLGRMLEAPEFAESRRVRRLIDIFDSRSALHEMLFASQPSDNIHVFIGGDGKKEWAEFADISLIASRYGVPDRATGVVGVIGPVRMAYRNNIGLVRFMATLMSAFVQEAHVAAAPSGDALALGNS